MTLRIFGIFALFVLTMVAPALAADMSIKARPASAVAAVYNWTGFYVGANAGYTWGGSDAVDLVSTPTFLVGPPLLGAQGIFTSQTFFTSANGVLNPHSSGFIGGGQIGYNWQFGDRYVAGFEADIQGIVDARGSDTRTIVVALPVPLFAPGNVAQTTLSATKSIDYLGTVRGRLGYLVSPTLLGYGTGGLAYGGVHSSASTFQSRNGPVVPFGAANSFSDTRIGWTAGGGGEWMFMRNWSAKVEYLYYDLGKATYDVGALNAVLLPPLPVPPAGTLGSASFSRAATRFNGHIVRAGINYHF
jgi:outer membrane immunogenic protein